VFAAIFGVYAIGRSWLGPVQPQAHISQNPRDLPLDALYSLVRISAAYALSLVFALGYGYVAASSRRAEIVMVPLLDILQSIRCSVFLPGVMLAMVGDFSAQPVRRRTRIDPADLHRAGMEHRVQFLFFPEDDSARTARSRGDLSIQPLAAFRTTRPSVLHDRLVWIP